jgi:tRNA threonylcarbamoyladenosine biosynthesis protein TsaB
LPLLINIDTATEVASVSVSLNGKSLDLIKSENQKEHASFIHGGIAALLKNTGYKLEDIDAFAITSGPGSYTGLRVGMATAKGFCYALSKPLIAINTLEVMTMAALGAIGKEEDILFCPMIDARRMEVFTAIYNSDMAEILPPAAVVLEEGLFDKILKDGKVMFFGSGSEKFKKISSGANATFRQIDCNAMHLGILANRAFNRKNFSNISYSEPTYFKEFQSNIRTN